MLFFVLCWYIPNYDFSWFFVLCGLDFCPYAKNLKNCHSCQILLSLNLYFSLKHLPIAAESIKYLSDKFCCFTWCATTASAIGDRQMFPKQIIKIPFFSDILKYFRTSEIVKTQNTHKLWIIDEKIVQWIKKVKKSEVRSRSQQIILSRSH